MSDPTSIKTPSDGNSDKNSCHPERSEGSQGFFGLRPQNDVCIAELLLRSQGYRLLAALLRHPKLGPGREVVQEDIDAWAHVLRDSKTRRKEQFEECTENLGRVFQETGFDSWAQQYESCLGHTAHAEAPAYELEYGEEHSHRQPQELADIMAFYQAFGLQVAGKAHERADHISVEFEFMHFLIYKEAYALQRGEQEHAAICQEAARRFLSEHLGQWLPAFSLRLSRIAEKGFMKQIADFALCWILADCEEEGIEAGDRSMPIRTIEEKLETGCVSCQLGPLAGQRGTA